MSLCIAQGSWAAAGSLWIVMEYCGGGSVADLVHAAEAPLDEGLISYICLQALAGLAYLHSLGKARPECLPMHPQRTCRFALHRIRRASSAGTLLAQ